VALACHAHELVDRHRRGSLGSYPDERQPGAAEPEGQLTAWGGARKGGTVSGPESTSQYGEAPRALHPAASVVRRREAGLRPAAAATSGQLGSSSSAQELMQ
jgi:hypothetical protein